MEPTRTRKTDPAKAALLADLRRRMARIEPENLACGSGAGKGRGFALGVPELDRLLPGGTLAPAALHEVVGSEDGAAMVFLALLAARRAAAAAGGGTVLWCTGLCGLYGPGLAAYGLHPDRLLLARADREADRLWAIEEGLQCRALAAVVGEARRLDLTASRRLQLAAESSGVTALLLRPPGSRLQPSAAATRWQVRAVPSAPGPSGELGAFGWEVALLRCRGGGSGHWRLYWDHETGALDLAAPLADGPAVPQPAAARA